MHTRTALLIITAFAFFAGFCAHDAMIKFIRDEAYYGGGMLLAAVTAFLPVGLLIRRITKQIDGPIK